MLNEQQIIDLLNARDKKVMAVLYDRYSPALYGVTCKIVKCDILAQDVLQDAFIKIWKNSTKYDRSKGTLFTWMLNITRNTAIDKSRSAHFRNSGKIQSIDHFVNNKEAGFSHEMEINHIGVRKKIETLEDKYRTIIDLIYFNGYTQREVAEKLDIPIGTVKSRIKIALRELKSIFSDKTSITLTRRNY